MNRLSLWSRALMAVCIVALFIGCTSPAGPDHVARAMRVAGVQLDPRTSSPVIMLQEEDGARRRLPIWIGVPEARSIALALENIPSPRPNSHDLIQNIVQEIDASVSRVLITELKAGTFYALLELTINGRQVEVDSRPSDAIAVATRTGTPVYATEEVLRQAGLLPETGEALDIDWKTEAEDSQRTH
jgi:bifunctional DNase/RNase